MTANDYEVNLKSELEILGLHEKMGDVRTETLAHLLKTQQQQIEMLEKVLKRT